MSGIFPVESAIIGTRKTAGDFLREDHWPEISPVVTGDSECRIDSEGAYAALGSSA